MKFRFLALLALVLGLASCQNDFEAGNAVAGGEVDFQLSVAAPELATRAGVDGVTPDGQADLNSAYGAIDYFQGGTAEDDLRRDWSDVNLRYTLEVYDAVDLEAGETYEGATPVKDRQVIIVDEYQPVTFELRLVPKRKYHFVVFADFVPQNVTNTSQSTAIALQENLGISHKIGETLADIKLYNHGINDERTDAYFAAKDFTLDNSASTDIVLKRPYGKLRVIATDLHELNLNVNPVAVKVEYTATHLTNFNAVTGKATVDANNTKRVFDSEYNEIYKEADKGGLQNHFYTTGYDALDGHKHTNADGDVRHTHMTLFTDYILADDLDQPQPVHFTMTVYEEYDNKAEDGRAIKSTTFNTDIPVQRNYLTTVIGNVLTTATEVEVTINDNFAGEYIYFDDTETTESFAKALKDAEQCDEAIIDLTTDVTWATGAGIGSTPWIPEGAKVKVLTVNANGHKITATGDGVGQIRMANGGKLIINNAIIEDKSVSYAENNWEYGYLEFGGKLEFNECEFVNAVMMSGEEATFNKCTFNSNKDSEYGVWVDNGKAYFNECTVTGPRGIKTHEAYGSEVVEIIVDKCTFNNISKKPGMAIGTVNAATKIEIKNSIFKNCQPGDQGLYIYETDTDVTTFDFNEENNVINFSIEDNTTLDEVLKANNTHISVDLTEDAIVEVSAWNDPYYLGGADTETITINGNGHTLTFNHNNTDWNYVRCANENTKLIIKNAKLSNSGKNNGPWNRHDITFNNPVVLENVTSDKAIALLANADLTNVVISDVHVDNSDAYALWIRPTGQTVNIKDCQLIAHSSKSGDRGIKIDNQYDDTPVKATLNVDGLKVQSQKKAAIVVKCPVGAEINLQNIDITEVAEDKINAVWVDEDAAASADLVVVTGGSKKIEGTATILAANDSTIKLDDNLNYGAVTAGELKNVTIEGADGAVMIFKTTADTKIENVTLKNVKFEYTGATVDCGIVIDANAQIDNLVVEGCTFVGTGAKAGRGISGLNNNASITLKSCTFKDLGYPIYAWGGYEALTIEGCTFDNIKSWAIMPQSGFDGDLTVTGNTFKNCLGGGLIKAGTLTAGHTFTFTNNVITNCTIAGDHNWFQFNVSAGTSVISGNTKDGADWTPVAADGLK